MSDDEQPPTNRYEPRPELERFQLGWICALPLEMTAAMAMLDVDYGPLHEREAGDNNVYWLGKIHHHHVVIATLPKKKYGTVSAALTARDMMRTFGKSLRFGLLVGIAGGIPRLPDQDIRLGDVVVSTPTGDSPGVYQYDLVKAEATQDATNFKKTGSLRPPSDDMLSVLTFFDSVDEAGRSKVPFYLRKGLNYTKKVKRTFAKPPTETDKLFNAANMHPRGARTCKDCPPEWEVERDPRDDDNPVVHYGIIGSGNAVIKDARVRESYADRLEGMLCFEMEAAGLMDHFPCLVFRGICDYADSHKNDAWQRYAAMTAAACAKEFLEYLPEESLASQRLVIEMIHRVEKGFDNMAQRFDGLEAQQQQLHQARAAERLMKKHQECHVVFKTSKYQEFKDFNREAVLGTWEWITKTERYKLWKNRSIHNLLWIAGEPGSGKSVLARYIFDNDLPIGHPSAAVCHFFFKDNNAQNSLATALCAILHQLFSQQPHLIRHAVPLWQSDGESIKTEVETLWKILLSATSDNEPRVTTICVLDAFDECDEKDRDKLVQMLKEVQGRAINAPASVLKILVTGRPYMSLSSTLQALVNSFLQIRLHDERYLHSVRNDIKLVIESQMKEVAQNPLTKISPPVQQRLVKELLDTGGNTYLWVQLVMEDLQDKLMKSLRPHKVKIDSLPGSVDDAYAEILKRVEKDHADVKMVLMIIVGARRALHCWEMGLAQGLVTEPDLQTRVDALADEDAVELKIRQICGGFIVIHDKFIHLHHQTAKEYLLKNDSADALKSKFCFSVADADELWANICLNYLLLDKDPKQEHESALTNHLGEYVSENWVNHLHSIPPSSRLRLEEVVYIIYAERYNEWHHSFWGTLIHHGHGPKPAFATHAAAVNGHTNILRRLLKTGKEHANQADNMGTTALLWSSWAGQYEASELLIDHGAKVNAASKRFGTPLLVAALKGHLKLVKLLLENGADANQLSGKRSMVQRQNSSPEEGYLSDYTGTALWAAALMGHLDIVKLLLDHGATDVDFALMSASRGGQLDVMRFLIEETNANRNAGDDGTFYGTAVQAASLGGHIEALELLVNAGFHDSEEYGYFESGLVAAACNGHDKIVQFHLDRGSYRYHDSSYMKALETACITGNLQIATALAPLVEDINATPLHSRNRVLQTAFEDGYPEIVLVLLHNKASFQEDNMLPRAARRGYVRVVEFLLEKGIDIDKGSPLLEAASAGHEEVVTLLVANGADVDQGYPLAAAARSGHDQIVKDLVEAGADVNGDCPLHAAIRHDHVRIAVYLIEKGANVNARRDGQTAFDVACAMNVEPMIRYILQQGGTIEGSN